MLERHKNERFFLCLSKIILIFFVFRLEVSEVHANSPLSVPQSNHALSAQEKASLRYHLKNLFNEVDLLNKNRKADDADLKRQEKDLDGLKVYQRIPLQRNLPELKRQLTASAKNFGLSLTDFHFLRLRSDSEPIPQKVFTADSSFHLRPDQVAETIEFQVTVLSATEGKQAVTQWVDSWLTEVMRLTEVRPGPHPIQALPGNRWSIESSAFRFRPIRFPTLVPRAPRSLLPAWAKSNPQEFAEKEPFLWDLLIQTERIIPETGPLYRNRSKFLLNDARLSFYLAKTGNS